MAAIESAAIREGNSGRRKLWFTITLSAAAMQSVTIGWATGDGTEVAARDYVAAGGRLTFAPGQTRGAVAVWVKGDRAVEADEDFRVTLTTSANAILSPTAGVASGRIVNDDGLSRRALAAAFAALEASGTTIKRRV